MCTLLVGIHAVNVHTTASLLLLLQGALCVSRTKQLTCPIQVCIAALASSVIAKVNAVKANAMGFKCSLIPYSRRAPAPTPLPQPKHVLFGVYASCTASSSFASGNIPASFTAGCSMLLQGLIVCPCMNNDTLERVQTLSSSVARGGGAGLTHLRYHPVPLAACLCFIGEAALASASQKR